GVSRFWPATLALACCFCQATASLRVFGAGVTGHAWVRRCGVGRPFGAVPGLPGSDSVVSSEAGSGRSAAFRRRKLMIGVCLRGRGGLVAWLPSLNELRTPAV